MSLLSRLLDLEIEKAKSMDSLLPQLSSSYEDNDGGVTLIPIIKKKKNHAKYRYGPRDSLNSRYHIGKPGSRRFNYWSSEFFARTYLHSDNESDFDSDIWDDEYDDKYAPSFGYFAEIFQDDNSTKSWDPFIEVTEEEQNKLLTDLSCEGVDDLSDSESSDGDILEDFERFEYMRRYSKQAILSNLNSHTLENIDKELYDLQDDEEEFQRVFSFSDSYRRLLVHSVSEFYNMTSYSKDTEEGHRITVVRKRDTDTSTETTLLSLLSN